MNKNFGLVEDGFPASHRSLPRLPPLRQRQPPQLPAPRCGSGIGKDQLISQPGKRAYRRRCGNRRIDHDCQPHAGLSGSRIDRRCRCSDYRGNADGLSFSTQYWVYYDDTTLAVRSSHVPRDHELGNGPGRRCGRAGIWSASSPLRQTVPAEHPATAGAPPAAVVVAGLGAAQSLDPGLCRRCTEDQ
jgi:hypothetical protein